jgi:hypothetical protein
MLISEVLFLHGCCCLTSKHTLLSACSHRIWDKCLLKMPLCERCILLTIDELVENDVLFQPDLGTLKSCGERGCEFCALCWATLQIDNRPQLDSLLRGESAWPSAETWTPTIWLRAGHFFHRGAAGTHITVSCGKAYSARRCSRWGSVSESQPRCIFKARGL